jgi:hypothetical protein
VLPYDRQYVGRIHPDLCPSTVAGRCTEINWIVARDDWNFHMALSHMILAAILSAQWQGD